MPDDLGLCLIQLMSMRMRIVSMNELREKKVEKDEGRQLHLLDPEHYYT